MRIDGVVYRPLLDPAAVSAVWLVQRKDQRSPMAAAFVALLTDGVELSNG
jgi:DNA-binding transcriptional LysR family regulator